MQNDDDSQLQAEGGTDPGSDFAWGASLIPVKKAIIEDDSKLQSDFWNWLRGLAIFTQSSPKRYGLREEEGWSPGMGSIVEELSDGETDLSTAASDGDAAMETGLLAHHHRTCQDSDCKLCHPS
eukprot:TRINITY_DN11389_c0_g1_i2.p1 TRINITY_DN11389_c0_g1~~TRINITY_DN11389_c0_g1_i2.p1  ORF type:complete len:124 (-),score=30.77 TRINITY_DN11389_c0_g1_i2:208-579(-)